MNPSSPSAKPALELIEEAVQHVRLAPLAALVAYYAGTLPFVLGLLYFWSDMSRSPVAHQHLAEAALSLAALFVWMKFCQAIFSARMRGAITGLALDFTPATRWRILISQAALQSSGLLLLPLSLLFVIPFPWVYAFYQNLTALAAEDSTGTADLAKKALRRTGIWSRQLWRILLLLAVFGFCVLVNWSIVCFILPGLARTLLGLQSTFTRSGTSMLNTTFFAAMIGLTYLSLDPVVKTLYVLRCFYGASLKSGEDLKAELREFARVGQHAATGLILMLMLCATSLRAAEPAERETTLPAQNSVSSSKLDHEISKVIRQTKYTWRSPREMLEPDSSPNNGILTRFLASARKMLKKPLEQLSDWLNKFRRTSRPASPGSSMASQQILLFALIAAAAVALAILLLRLLRGRAPHRATLASVPIPAAPDLTDENLAADQLPEDGWTRLARELLERGELRLALRAFYFASLAHLAGRNLIRLVKSKSNREYERELGRRGHAFPQLLAVFGENVSVFDRSWYGLHEVNNELVRRFAENVDRLKAGQ